MSDLVNWSVAECNRKYGAEYKRIGENCPGCGKDDWRCVWGINPAYRCPTNPGEFIQYVCRCGYIGEERPS